MKNLLLVLVALTLFVLLEPFSFVYVNFVKKKFNWKRLFDYWRSMAVDIDRFGNHQYRSLFNHIFIQQDGYQFGNFKETVSSALGKNQHFGKLTKTGKLLVSILDFIDENHCLKSINWEI
ncbi:hypothetical protein [Faecalibacter bovis]|uniref:Uncharacterized protein n=1 Tax=Faecalibacter bovis TaxID=2898187 RepID=A0ABX7XDV4_9FLAO|nr:hypothetical protein [Faecalibacter bovis]QTV06070.1 hypothetical protein J9309_01595 [Faecalibacter bovis]